MTEKKKQNLNIILKISKDGKVKPEIGNPKYLTDEEVEERGKKHKEDMKQLESEVSNTSLIRYSAIEEAQKGSYIHYDIAKEIRDEQRKELLDLADPTLKIFNDNERQLMDAALGFTEQSRSLIDELSGLGVDSLQTDYLKHQLDGSLNNYRTPELHNEISEIYLSELKQLKGISQALVEPYHQLSTQIHESLITQGVLENDLDSLGFDVHNINDAITRHNPLNLLPQGQLLGFDANNIANALGNSYLHLEDELYKSANSLLTQYQDLDFYEVAQEALLTIAISDAIILFNELKKHKKTKSIPLFTDLKDKVLAVALQSIGINKDPGKATKKEKKQAMKDLKKTNKTTHHQDIIKLSLGLERQHLITSYLFKIVFSLLVENGKLPKYSDIKSVITSELIILKSNKTNQGKALNDDRYHYEHESFKYEESKILSKKISNGFEWNNGNNGKPFTWNSLNQALTRIRKISKEIYDMETSKP